ncbi:hypothetical protein [Amycolatopsis sp. H20-H5]|uniref:hypothetical protein n=1 Tax=Amycolatopsis sp. H20-H5 TaxID=3046309 RepID=UPI002DBEF47A|nr:hypothetical protein [Amycolatopsis sp. H20-H5]MEC3979040.1 hypothetical protein [Amycolatopsis sp. H20-H5]
MIARDLLEYGENNVSAWIHTTSEDEFLRICGVADWLTLYGPTTSSGTSMTLGKASALASVFIREGIPRELAKKRRKPLPALHPQEQHQISADGRPDLNLQMKKGAFYGITEKAKQYWTGGT